MNNSILEYIILLLFIIMISVSILLQVKKTYNIDLLINNNNDILESFDDDKLTTSNITISTPSVSILSESNINNTSKNLSIDDLSNKIKILENDNILTNQKIENNTIFINNLKEKMNKLKAIGQDSPNESDAELRKKHIKSLEENRTDSDI